jgi:hypothetical protein
MRNGHLDATREGSIQTTRRNILDGMRFELCSPDHLNLWVHLHPARPDRGSGLLSAAKVRKATTVFRSVSPLVHRALDAAL